jgi:hypothetical protein
MWINTMVNASLQASPSSGTGPLLLCFGTAIFHKTLDHLTFISSCQLQAENHRLGIASSQTLDIVLKLHRIPRGL